MTSPSWIPPSDPTPGEVLHRAREAGNDGRDRPMFLAPWADRDPRLKELDEAMAAAVAAQATADVRSALAAADNTIGQVIRLAESWRMQGGLDLDVEHVARVLLETCKPWRGGEERSDKGDRP